MFGVQAGDNLIFDVAVCGSSVASRCNERESD